MAAAPAAPSQYDIQRNRIKQDSASAGGEQNDALKRRFARMGGLNSGSYAKASERLAGQQEQNQQKAIEGVDVQESVANEQKAELERGRAFATSERLGSQGFAGEQSALGRAFSREERIGSQGFATSERLGGQDFAGNQANLGRQFATSERLGGQQFASGESALGRAFSRQERESGQGFQKGENDATRSAQESQFTRSLGETQAARGQQNKQWQDTFNRQGTQFDQQFASDQNDNVFNRQIAAAQLQVDPRSLEIKQELARMKPSDPGYAEKYQKAYGETPEEYNAPKGAGIAAMTPTTSFQSFMARQQGSNRGGRR